MGGGVIETAPWFRTWFLDTVRAHTTLRLEQAERTEFASVLDLHTTGASGAALAALWTVG